MLHITITDGKGKTLLDADTALFAGALQVKCDDGPAVSSHVFGQGSGLEYIHLLMSLDEIKASFFRRHPDAAAFYEIEKATCKQKIFDLRSREGPPGGATHDRHPDQRPAPLGGDDLPLERGRL